MEHWALVIETGMDPAALRKQLEKWAPWGVRIEFSNGVSTADLTPDTASSIPLWKLDQFEAHVPIAEARDVLDVGCHVGYNSIELARRQKARCTGIDVYRSHLEAARFLAELAGVKCEFEFGHAEDFIRPESFDLVLHLGTLYHLSHPLAALRAAWENLRPGGWLCLETQTYDDPADERLCYWLHGLNNDLSNFFALSTPTILEALGLIGFDQITEVKRHTTTAGEREHMYRVYLAARKISGLPLEQRWPVWTRVD